MSENSSFKCYQQGYTDVCTTLGDKVPPTMLLDDPVSEEADGFNPVAYLQGQMSAMLEHIKRQDRANNYAHNVASCLANGIQPD